MSETQQQWTIIWDSDDGPSALGLYTDDKAALHAAWQEWVFWEGGNLGGYDTGSFKEFMAMYAESPKLWIVPIGETS